MDNIKISLIDAKQRMNFLYEEAEDIKLEIEQLVETLQGSFKQLMDISISHYNYTKELNDNIIEIESHFESLITKQVDTKHVIPKIQTDTSFGSSGGPAIKKDEPSPKKVIINEDSPRKVTINAKDEYTR